MPLLTVTFEELPVLVQGGFEAGSLNGTAEVSYHADGELSNRLYQLDELNRREREESDRKTNLYVSAICALGMFCIVAALFGGSP